eukprot:CFRG0878T1
MTSKKNSHGKQSGFYKRKEASTLVVQPVRTSTPEVSSLIVECTPLLPETRGFYKRMKVTMTRTNLFKDQIFTLSDFLSTSECSAWIDYGEKKGFEPSYQKQNRDCAHRDNGRIQIESEVIAQSFYERLQKCIPSKIDNRKPVACNPNIRLYKYGPGQSFGRHVDESVRDVMGRKSVYTVLVYLNGQITSKPMPTAPTTKCESNYIEDRFEEKELILVGGETRFYLHHHSNTVACSIRPVKGAALLHGHGDKCLTHEGMEVTEGVKYLLRTDVIKAWMCTNDLQEK